MASPSLLHFLSLSLAFTFLISPSQSLTCTSQIFTQKNTPFTDCSDLPALKAFIHWTYNATAKPKPTLSIAFIAPPPNPDGWIAWGLNPTGTGMAGAQSFIAFKDSKGVLDVKTYNISSYSSIVEGKIFYDVLKKKAEFSDKSMRIFATLALPKGVTEVNHLWQVGAEVKDGKPQRHDFGPENLNAKGTLQLVAGKKAAGGPSPAPAPASGNTSVSGGQSGNDTGGSSRIFTSGIWVHVVLLCLGFYVW